MFVKKENRISTIINEKVKMDHGRWKLLLIMNVFFFLKNILRRFSGNTKNPLATQRIK